MQTHFLYMQSSQSIFSVITFQRFLFPFFPGIHMACSLWFYLNVTLFPQVVSVWNGPISNPSPRGINLMIFQCDLMSQVWSWCLAFFFFFFTWACLLGEPIHQQRAVKSRRWSSLVLQGLLRHDWLTTSPFFPSHLHGEKHWVMRGDVAAE